MFSRLGAAVLRTVALLLCAIAATDCAREAASDRATAPTIALHRASEDTRFEVVVSRLAADDIRTLQRWEPTRAEWVDVLRVRVAADAHGSSGSSGSSDRPAVAGRYAVIDGDIHFTPLFPFEPGRRYEATFDPARAAALETSGSTPSSASAASAPPSASSLAPITTIIQIPAAPVAPASTVVQRVTPSGDRVPENLLRMYIHFSAPMGLRGGLDYVHLLDERGREIVDPFLPVEAEFWNHDRTRYTLFLDPGRVKRGVRPNEQMGRSLDIGRTYTLAIDTAWRDAHGQPLAQPFRQTFRAGPAIERPLAIADWQIAAPLPDTRDPLIVTFPHALDHGLLLRAIGVETRAGAPIAGEITVDQHERRWSFVPRDPWRADDNQLVVLTILEDPSGNRIGRAFETPESPRPGSPLSAAAARADEPARVTRAFRIARTPQAKGTT